MTSGERVGTTRVDADLIKGISSSLRLAAGHMNPSYDRFGTWLMVLGLYDLIFGLVGYAVFDFLLED